MKGQSWISHLVLGQLLFGSTSAVLLNNVDPSMAEYSEKKDEPHPEMLEALEKQGVNVNHFKRLLNAFRDPEQFRELAGLANVDDLIPTTEATVKALSDDEYTYSWGSTTVTTGSCSPDTNSGIDTDDTKETFRHLRALSSTQTVTAEIMLGTSGDAVELMCDSGTLTDPTTECGTSGKFLYYAGQAICKLATADAYYDCSDDQAYCDDETPTSLPSPKPTSEPSPVPTPSPPTVLSSAPTMSPMPTIPGPTKLPTPLPTAVPTPSWAPSVAPSPFPTNPDDSAYCTTVKFTCAVDTQKVTFPKANHNRLNIYTVQASMYGLMWYFGDVVQYHMKAGTTKTVNWWSDLKVSAPSCTLYFNGRNGDTTYADYKYYAGINPSYVTTAKGCDFKSDDDDDSDTIAGMDRNAAIAVFSICGFVFIVIVICVIYCFCCKSSDSSKGPHVKDGVNPNQNGVSSTNNPGNEDWQNQGSVSGVGDGNDWAKDSTQGTN